MRLISRLEMAKYFWNYFVRDIVRLANVIATDVTRVFQFYVPKGNLVLEIVLVTYEEALLFTATLFVLLQLVTPRRFFFAVVKEPGAPLTKCCGGRFALRDVISRCIIYRDVSPVPTTAE